MPNRRTSHRSKPNPVAPFVAQYVLPNGIFVLHRQATATRLVHIAVVLNVGSRDEAPEELGMAHCLEHMAFKGTRRRKAYHILSRIDSVGGELNAYTTKEKIAYYVTVTAEHLARGVELLADITFGPTFPAHELAKERTVIADEIDSYRDDPEEAIFEDFDTLLYSDHALGHPILGTRSSLAGFTSEALAQFHRKALAPGRIAVSIAGNAPPGQTRRLVARYFGEAALPGRALQRVAPQPVLPSSAEQVKSISQAHLLLGGFAYPFTDSRHPALVLLLNYLGGPSMNSRLSLLIRERHGLSYSIQSFQQPYTDSGLWGIYASCEPANLPKLQRLIRQELAQLLREPVSPTAFHRMQQQFLGSLVLSYESLFHQMISQAKELLDFGRWFSLEELLSIYSALKPQDLYGVSLECFSPEALATLTYFPEPDGGV